MLQEAFGDLLELDSRLWRTLIPLAVRPGQLTRDYLEGRRARFMPPFRTYLVLSIFFFLIAFFDPRQELGIFFEPEEDVPAEAPGDQQGSDEIREEILSELVEEGVLSAEQAGLEQTENDRPKADSTPDSGAEPESGEEDAGHFNITLDGDDVAGGSDCETMKVENMPEWMASRLTPERLQAVCERLFADGGKAAFFGKLLDNIPAALFILLPLMALILKILYPLSKRFYVEHLLFVVHYHAFVFLILTLQILFGRLAALFGFPDGALAITITAVTLYIPVYLYKSMRRVYEQGHIWTIGKFLVLVTSYFIGLGLIFLAAAVISAFSI